MNHSIHQPIPPDPIASKLAVGLLPAFGHAFLLLWPYLLIPVAIYLLRMLPGLLRRLRLSAAGLPEIDRVDGAAFVRLLGGQFRRIGYAVDTTPKAGDFGADLILRKDGVRIAVQAKRWAKPVGVGAVQEVVAAKAHYGCAKAMVVANQMFTKAAQELARSNDVALWDRDALAQLLIDGKRQASEGPVPPSVALALSAAASAAAAPTPEWAVCSTCGRIVPDNVADYCRDHADRFAGRIYCFAHQRNAGPSRPLEVQTSLIRVRR